MEGAARSAPPALSSSSFFLVHESETLTHSSRVSSVFLVHESETLTHSSRVSSVTRDRPRVLVNERGHGRCRHRSAGGHRGA
eukprot:6356196-Prymnesium_polylepis.1